MASIPEAHENRSPKVELSMGGASLPIEATRYDVNYRIRLRDRQFKQQPEVISQVPIYILRRL